MDKKVQRLVSENAAISSQLSHAIAQRNELIAIVTLILPALTDRYVKELVANILTDAKK